jgi:hypothetical protein
VDLINKLIGWVDALFELFGPFAGWFVIALLFAAFGNVGKVFGLKIKV